MSFRHPRVEAWESRLRSVFARIDGELDREFGGRLPRHPARAGHGAMANPDTSSISPAIAPPPRKGPTLYKVCESGIGRNERRMGDAV